MKTLIVVIITLTFSIITQASIPDRNPGLIYEVNTLERALNSSILY